MVLSCDDSIKSFVGNQYVTRALQMHLELSYFPKLYAFIGVEGSGKARLAYTLAMTLVKNHGYVFHDTGTHLLRPDTKYVSIIPAHVDQDRFILHDNVVSIITALSYRDLNDQAQCIALPFFFTKNPIEVEVNICQNYVLQELGYQASDELIYRILVLTDQNIPLTYHILKFITQHNLSKKQSYSYLGIPLDTREVTRQSDYNLAFVIRNLRHHYRFVIEKKSFPFLEKSLIANIYSRGDVESQYQTLLEGSVTSYEQLNRFLHGDSVTDITPDNEIGRHELENWGVPAGVIDQITDMTLPLPPTVDYGYNNRKESVGASCDQQHDSLLSAIANIPNLQTKTKDNLSQRTRVLAWESGHIILFTEHYDYVRRYIPQIKTQLPDHEISLVRDKIQPVTTISIWKFFLERTFVLEEVREQFLCLGGWQKLKDALWNSKVTFERKNHIHLSQLPIEVNNALRNKCIIVLNQQLEKWKSYLVIDKIDVFEYGWSNIIFHLPKDIGTMLEKSKTFRHHDQLIVVLDEAIGHTERIDLQDKINQVLKQEEINPHIRILLHLEYEARKKIQSYQEKNQRYNWIVDELLALGFTIQSIEKDNNDNGTYQ